MSEGGAVGREGWETLGVSLRVKHKPQSYEKSQQTRNATIIKASPERDARRGRTHAGSGRPRPVRRNPGKLSTSQEGRALPSPGDWLTVWLLGRNGRREQGPRMRDRTGLYRF